MILLLGGTTEARTLAQVLRSQGYPVWVSVASDFARNFLPQDIPMRSGPFSAESLEAFLHTHHIRVIIDATHPFAQDIKRNARRVAQALHIPYLAYERPRVETPTSVIRVGSFLQAVEALSPYERIFLAIGSKNLAPFVNLKKKGKAIRVRVLPVSSSLKRCEDLGLQPQEIVAISGPVSTALNRILFEEFGADVVVSKESGREGGLLEKVEATVALGIPLVLIERPRSFGEVFYELGALLDRLGELYGS
jgi:precorrin-6A/cobalt-precorrin-6A reductase